MKKILKTGTLIAIGAAVALLWPKGKTTADQAHPVDVVTNTVMAECAVPVESALSTNTGEVKVNVRVAEISLAGWRPVGNNR